MLLWHTLGTYFRIRYGKRVQKIPLDIGASCPNRDGSLSHSGCIFCNAQGSGSGLLEQGKTIQEQWAYWQVKYLNTDANRSFMAYLQSFSNTYMSLEKLNKTLNTLSELPQNMGLSIGTRPDCVDEYKLDCIASCDLPEVWIEYGLQTCNDASLKRINRHHTIAQSEKAIYMAHERGIKVCGHLMAGLPNESGDDFLKSVQWAKSLPIQGLKLHSLYVCQNSTLAHWYTKKQYQPITKNEYVELLAQALCILPSTMVMHRLTGDPAPGELIAPEWVRHKRPIFTDLYHYMKSRKLWQGVHNDAKDTRPEWFGG